MVKLSGVRIIILGGVYLSSRLRRIKAKSVEIESVKSEIQFLDKAFPVREFRIYNRRQKCVAISKVMSGRFEERTYQYCVSYDLHVNALYRHRGYAEKMLLRQLEFCQKEGFEFLIAVIRKENIASISLFSKLGFKIMCKSEGPAWGIREAQLYREDDMCIAVYALK